AGADAGGVVALRAGAGPLVRPELPAAAARLGVRAADAGRTARRAGAVGGPQLPGVRRPDERGRRGAVALLRRRRAGRHGRAALRGRAAGGAGGGDRRVEGATEGAAGGDAAAGPILRIGPARLGGQPGGPGGLGEPAADGVPRLLAGRRLVAA